MASATRAFCSTSTMVSPYSRLSRTTRSMTCAMTRGARPSDGSSSSSTRGRASRARAMTSICRSPPDSVEASLRRRSASGLKRSYSSSIAAARADRVPRHDIIPIRRFSSTVSSGITPCPSGTWAMPARTICSGLWPATLWSASRTRPRRGLIMPLTARSSVVLPAPFAPSTAVMPAASAVTVTPSSTVTPPYPATSPSTSSEAEPPFAALAAVASALTGPARRCACRWPRRCRGRPPSPPGCPELRAATRWR
jgi:hypothetical protein